MIPMFMRINRWTLFFYVAHIFGLVSAVSMILISVFAQAIENATIGDFHLNVTFVVVVVFYIAAGFLIFTVVIGFLAQRFADKPSLWILYCIVLSIVALVLLTASVSATSRGRVNKIDAHNLKTSMEFYVANTTNATKWDNFHKKYKCCGVESYKDWQDVQFGRTSLRVPQSCCLPRFIQDDYCGLNILPHRDDADSFIYARGCLEPGMQGVNTILTVLGILGLCVSVIHMTLASLSCYLVITKKV